jgi:hypothetical protein
MFKQGSTFPPLFSTEISQISFDCLDFLVKGQNYKNQNVKSQKEHQKFEKDQNVKSFHLKDQNVERSERQQLPMV